MAALFLIVVLAAIGAFAIQIGGTQQQTVNLALLGARAQAAANTGIEWGSTRIVAAPNVCPSGVLSLTQGALAGFTVKITAGPAPCPTSHIVNSTPSKLYTFTAVATRGTYGSADFVSRTVTRTVSNAPLPP